jgi:polysaccharide biosynthesis transport protein
MHQRTFPLNSRVAVSQDEADRFIDLEQLIAIAWRQARLVGLCAALGLALGVLYLLFTPQVYTSYTNILLDENLARFAEDDRRPTAGRPEAESMISSEVEIMKSARLARSVVLSQRLHENPAFLSPQISPIAWVKGQIRAVLGMFFSTPVPPSPGVSAEDLKIQRATELLQNSITAERLGRSFVVALSFQSTDPQLAGAVTRAYANAYLSDQLDANFDATQRATVWLQGRLADLRENSQAAASEAERFKAEHGLTAARGELLSEQQLSDLNKQLILAQAETANAFARYSQYKSIIDSGPENAVRNATIPADQASNPALGDLRDLKTRYLNVTKRERDIVSRFGEDHPQAVNLRREQEDMTRRIFEELKKLTESYRNEYEVAKARETSLRTNVGQMAGDSSTAGQSMVRLRELEQKAEALATLYQTYLARYEEVSQQRSFPIAKARVISEAVDPRSPSSPQKSMVLALSLVLGLFGGAGVAAYQEFRERFFRTGDDVRAALNVNFLGYLPVITRQPKPAKPVGAKAYNDSRREEGEPLTPRILRVAINSPTSSFAETLRNAKLATDVVLQGTPCKVIGFVSVLPHEGKTTAAANFAGLLAANGARTLLIDGDLRNPGLSRALSIASEKGLVDAVVGEQRWQNAVKIDRSTKLAILPAAVRSRLSHTSELLSGPGMRDLVEDARKSFDYIVVDLPPLAPVVDAKAFAPFADGFIMVTAWGATPRALVRSTLQSEPLINSKVLGVILNKTDMKKLARFGSLGGYEQYLDRYSSYYTDQTGLNGKA